ncbi:Methionine-rich peptide X [Nocardioides aquaticus]|uniref:Methionine-rich peptide X n=1 Tax=Nocardioides aquaticus TaxID=160826 RepID=A0ABX8EFQ3_9ACTN|nr:DUF305 domain-containing protein [Nocardioides aquaticus]QVT79335.1 Methionine-rich peptide X [Nocardioides aquaticus]
MSAIALGLTLALAAAACGDSDDTSSSGAETSTTEHNDTDVAFASDMLQHHTQALDVVDLTQGRDLDLEVQQLADDIRAAQAPEIETFTGWLTDWDEAVPATSTSGSMRDRDMPRMGGSMRGRDGMRRDAMRGDAMRGDAMRGDGMRGDAMRGDAMRGDAMRGDAMRCGG